MRTKNTTDNSPKREVKREKFLNKKMKNEIKRI